MWLFDTSLYNISDTATGWSILLTMVYVSANFILALSLYLISASLYILYNKKKDDLTNNWMLILFIIFIALCATTYIDNVFIFIWPVYRFFTLITIVTASVAFTTAICMPRIISIRIKERTHEQLERMNTHLLAEIDERLLIEQNLRKTVNELESHTTQLENAANVGDWISQSQVEIENIRKTIQTIRISARS